MPGGKEDKIKKGGHALQKSDIMGDSPGELSEELVT